MIKDCIIKEYKLYDNEAKTVAKEMKDLLNEGYNVDLKYSNGNLGSILLVATKGEVKAKTKTTKKEEE